MQKKDCGCRVRAVFVMLLMLMTPAVYGQPADDLSYEQSSFSSYGFYTDAVEEPFVPHRIAPLKLLTFPVMLVAAPIAFPTYYIFTTEPTFSKSWSNYWDWIYFRVPYDVDVIADQDTTVSPKKGRTPPPAKVTKKRSWFTFFKGKPRTVEEGEEEKRAEEKKQRKIQSLLAKGEKLYTKHKYEKASELYADVLDIDPGNQMAERMVITIQQAQKQAQQTELAQQQAKAEQKRRKQIEKYVTKGQKAYTKQKYIKARTYYQEVLALDPDHTQAKAMLEKIATEYVQQEKMRAAGKKPKEPTEPKERTKAQEEIETLTALADAQLNEKNYKEARARYKDILLREPGHVQAQKGITTIERYEKVAALLDKGEELMAQGKHAEAVRLARQALLLDAHNTRAQELIAHGSEQEATQTLLTDAERSLEAGQYDAAMAVYKKVLRQDPNNTQAQEMMASIERRKTVEALLAEGKAQFEEQNLSAALASYQQVFTYDLNNAEAQGMVTKILEIQRTMKMEEEVVPVVEPSALQNIIRNGSFESWSEGTHIMPDGWSGGGGKIEQEDSIVKLGAHAIKITRSGAPTNIIAPLNRADKNWYVDKRERTWTTSCWVKSSIGRCARIGLFDGRGFTWSEFHSGNGEWELLSVTKPFSSDATAFGVACVLKANGTAYFDGVMVVEGEEPVAFASHALDS